jgi:uncharacterized protein (TIGR02246 family)
MRLSLGFLAILALGLTTPASAQDAATEVKSACESYNQKAATGDAALVANHYTEKAMFIGPEPIQGILNGREAIEKSYAETFKTFKAISATCENVRPLSDSIVLLSGHWVGTPRDPSGPTLKGTYGITYVKEAGKWLVALDTWNLDMPASPAKSQ